MSGDEMHGTAEGEWKCGNEFLPYHPQASHVEPAYRDGWNACYRAAQAHVQPKGTEPVGYFIEDFGGEKGRWQQCTKAAHYTVALFREPAQARASGIAEAVAALESAMHALKMRGDDGTSPVYRHCVKVLERHRSQAPAPVPEAPAPAPESTAERLLTDLNALAQRVDPHMYGLPIDEDGVHQEMLDTVAAWARSPHQPTRHHSYGQCTITGPEDDIAFIFRHLPDVDDAESLAVGAETDDTPKATAYEYEMERLIHDFVRTALVGSPSEATLHHLDQLIDTVRHPTIGRNLRSMRRQVTNQRPPCPPFASRRRSSGAALQGAAVGDDDARDAARYRVLTDDKRIEGFGVCAWRWNGRLLEPAYEYRRLLRCEVDEACDTAMQAKTVPPHPKQVAGVGCALCGRNEAGYYCTGDCGEHQGAESNVPVQGTGDANG